MPVKLLEKICRYIYFCGITNVRIENRYAKVLLVPNAFRIDRMKIEPDYFIDKAMIPYKGKKQEIYSITSKANQKVGIKFLFCATLTGIVYDFLPYSDSAMFLDLTVDKCDEAL